VRIKNASRVYAAATLMRELARTSTHAHVFRSPLEIVLLCVCDECVVLVRWPHFLRPSRGVVKRVNPAVKRPTTTTATRVQQKPACALCVCEFSLSIDRLAREINFLPRPLRRIHNTRGERGRERKETALRRRRNNFSLRDIGGKSIPPTSC
jgi:hypothetical protein